MFTADKYELSQASIDLKVDVINVGKKGLFCMQQNSHKQIHATLYSASICNTQK